LAAITNEQELEAAIKLMRAAGTDLAEYELKTAVGDFPKSTVETISAFANTHGGVLIFGIKEGAGFKQAAGFDPKKTQASCAQAAREAVEPPVQADIHVMMWEDAPVVVANIPECPARRKPCYVRKYGQREGSYIRTGDGDHKMTPYEIDRFIESQLRSARHDMAIVPDATLADLDKELLQAWLASERATSFGRTDAMDDETLMANRRVIAEDEQGVLRPTVAGILALGVFPQKFFPRLNVVFSSYPAGEKGQLSSRGKRFVDTANIEGPIPQMVLSALRILSRNIRHGAIVKGALREDVPDYPLNAVREAVANALMHRDLSPESQSEPVLMELYPDRLEISNPGGLYGSLTVDQLGKRGGTASRNQALARILEDTPYVDIDGTQGKVVENRGTGYRIIENSLAEALMDKPVIDARLDHFTIMFRHRSMTEQEGAGYSRNNVSEAILAFMSSRESVSTSEVAYAAGISKKTASKYLKELLNQDLIEGIGSLNSPKRRYRLKGRQ
jgi:ATP-dependent DNA helicase RecG